MDVGGWVGVYILIAYYKSKVIRCIFIHSFLTTLQICGKCLLQDDSFHLNAKGHCIYTGSEAVQTRRG